MSNLYNSTLELTSLACLLQDASQFTVAEDILTKESFRYPAHAHIYTAMSNCVSADLYPDVVTVSAELDKQGKLETLMLENGMSGLEALRYIAGMTVNAENFESYALQVQQLQANRQLMLLSAKIEKMVSMDTLPIDTLATIDLETGKIGAFVGSKSSTVKSAGDSVNSAITNFEDARNGVTRFIKTGLDAWDRVTNGLFKQRLYLIAARPGQGKSALVHNFIKLLSIDKAHKVHIFSLEMSAEDLVNRLVQILTGISPLDIETGKLAEKEIPLFSDAMEKIAKATYTCDDSSELSLALLRTKARKAKANGAELIIIDQLEQLSIGGSGDAQPEYIKVNYIAYRIKALSRELDIPIVLVHQLNRGTENQQAGQGKRDPQLSDLAQAGEKAPDVVIMLRTEYDPAFFFVKHRQGKKGKEVVGWQGEKIRFYDTEEVFPEKLL